MGVDIHFEAEIRPKGLMKKKPTNAEVLKQAALAIQGFIKDQVLLNLISVTPHAHGMYLSIHPAAEAMRFAFDQEGKLHFDARTNGAGPGYHAFVVKIIDELVKSFGFDFKSGKGPDKIIDEYYFHRDFPKMMIEHLMWLMSMVIIIEREDRGKHAGNISMPMDFNVATDYYAATYLGFKPREWFESFANGDDNQKAKMAAEWFPWVKPQMDADFWIKLGMVLAWNELPWRSPTDKKELMYYMTALKCFDNAKQRDPNAKMPDQVISEMMQILKSGPDGIKTPRPGEIGYRRYDMWKHLNNGWSILVPGYFNEQCGDDGEVRWIGDNRVIVLEFWDIDDTKANALLGRQAVTNAFATLKNKGIKHEHENGPLYSLAQQEKVEQEGQTIYGLAGYSAVENDKDLVKLAIRYNGENDLEWAMKTWKSLAKRTSTKRPA